MSEFEIRKEEEERRGEERRTELSLEIWYGTGDRNEDAMMMWNEMRLEREPGHEVTLGKGGGGLCQSSHVDLNEKRRQTKSSHSEGQRIQRCTFT
jgi:hypothetical protein